MFKGRFTVVMGVFIIIILALLTILFQIHMLNSMRGIGRGLPNSFHFAVQQLVRESDLFLVHLGYIPLAMDRWSSRGGGLDTPSSVFKTAMTKTKTMLDVLRARAQILEKGSFQDLDSSTKLKIQPLVRELEQQAETMDRAIAWSVLTIYGERDVNNIKVELVRTIDLLKIYSDLYRRKQEEEARLHYNRFGWYILGVGLLVLLPCLAMVLLISFQNVRLLEKREKLKRAQQELETALCKTTAILESRNSLLANVSHEMRTPLNAIMGFSEIISRQFFGVIGNDRYIAYARDIHDSSRSLLELVDDLLLLRSIEAGSHAVEMTEVNVAAIVERVHKSVAGLAAARSITLDVVQSEALSVQADERALRQILTNLVENAVKYSFEGGTVTLAVRREGKKVRFIVLDEGPGIAEDQIPGLFQPFQRGENPMVRQAKGAGLGLAIVKALVSAMHSTVHLAAMEPTGLRVYFDLPEGRRDYELAGAAGATDLSPA